jgi:hypothetical protein
MYNFLDEVSYSFLDVINSVDNVVELTTEDYGWSNYRYKSDVFRMAHVERYTDSKVDVLHITTFPHHWSPEPIFGFDVILTDNNPIGAYMDLSPGLKTYPFDEDVVWDERKPLPEWATVFSDRFILIKPSSMDELKRFCDWAISKYNWYINDILHMKETGDYKKIIEIQNNYCEIQSKNPRTYNVLKKKIGEISATYFMENILFPKIKFY